MSATAESKVPPRSLGKLPLSFSRHGIGYQAIAAMMNAITSRLGVSKFRVRIDPSNPASQKLFEKLGTQPNGISEFLIHNQEALQKVEEENLYLIALAARFGSESRNLLSHVLEYTLTYSLDPYQYLCYLFHRSIKLNLTKQENIQPLLP